MANYLESDKIEVYPAGHRGTGFPLSKLNTEFNITYAKLGSKYVNNNNFFITDPWGGVDTTEAKNPLYYIIAIRGYYFRVGRTNLLDALGDISTTAGTDTPIYAAISLKSDTNVKDILVKYEQTDGDQITLDDEGKFKGLGFITNTENLSSNNYVQIATKKDDEVTLIFQPLRFSTDEIRDVKNLVAINEKFNTDTLTSREATFNKVTVDKKGDGDVNSYFDFKNGCFMVHPDGNLTTTNNFIRIGYHPDTKVNLSAIAITDINTLIETENNIGALSTTVFKGKSASVTNINTSLTSDNIIGNSSYTTINGIEASINKTLTVAPGTSEDSDPLFKVTAGTEYKDDAINFTGRTTSETKASATFTNLTVNYSESDIVVDENSKINTKTNIDGEGVEINGNKITLTSKGSQEKEENKIELTGAGKSQIVLGKDGVNVQNSIELYGSTSYINLNNVKNGYIKVSGENSYITAPEFRATSDARLKENIIDYKPEKSILNLSIKKFDYIDGSKNQIGCLAQDLQEICPEIVKEDESGYLTINENKIVYLLLDEVKKLKEEVNNLKRGD